MTTTNDSTVTTTEQSTVVAASPKKAKKAPTAKKVKDPKEKRPVIVCSNNAVLYGYSLDTTKSKITLSGCRWAYYWVNQGGHLGLAETGPQADSRIGSAGTITVGSIACVIEVTDEAAKVWDNFPVSTK